jgi:Type IV secretory pathway, TrbF components
MFNKHRETFTDGDVGNPAEQFSKEWEGRIGDMGVRMHNQRRIIIGLIISHIILASGLTVQSLKSHVEPYVLEMDGTTGAVRNIGLIGSEKYVPKEENIKYFIAEFIKNARSMPLDPVIYDERRNSVYNFLTDKSQGRMDAEIQAEKSRRELGKKAVTVQIVSILPVEKSNNSYQVRWNEEEVIVGSGAKTVVPMTGVFSIAISSPDKIEKAMKNPLGIYFTDFSFSKDASVNK